MNPLMTKMNVNCVNIQFIPRSEHIPFSVLKTNQLMFVQRSNTVWAERIFFFLILRLVLCIVTTGLQCVN
jgi:hypothetical protein